MSENTTQSGYKEKEDLVVTRIIDAPIELVWKTWTDPEHVMKWWGPKYYTSPSCKIDLREGGRYVFCMRAPQNQGGQDSYTAGIFKKIVPMELLEFTQGMADQDGNPIDPAQAGMPPDFPKADPNCCDLQTVSWRYDDGTDRHRICLACQPNDGLFDCRVAPVDR